VNAFVASAYRRFGPLVERLGPDDDDLQMRLVRADISLLASAFRASVWLASLVAAAAGALVGLAIAALIGADAAWPYFVIPVVIGASLAGASHVAATLWVDNRAKERGRDIDENLPHGIYYMLALAHAGLPPREIWASLSDAPVFGSLAVEAMRIRRDLQLFGHDLLTALREAQKRTPSERFAEFLQGAVSTFQSGIELETYLTQKARQYSREDGERQKKDLETMSVMAEAFLVVVVAAPLFLIILLTVMAINQGPKVLGFGYLLSLVVVPIAQLTLGGIVKSLNPRVWS